LRRFAIPHGARRSTKPTFHIELSAALVAHLKPFATNTGQLAFRMFHSDHRLTLLLAFAVTIHGASRVGAQDTAPGNRPRQVSVETRPPLPIERTAAYTPAPMLSPPAAPASYVAEASPTQSVQLASHSEPEAASRYEPIPLRTGGDQRLTAPPSRSTGAGKAGATVATSLAIVITAFFVLVWLSRKAAPKGLASLPSEVVESLGRAQLNSRQQMQLVRLGRKLVLLSVTSTGVETITEVTDLEEVERLCALCQQNRPGSMSETFRQVLSQFGNEPAPAGFIGDPAESQLELANRATARTSFEEEYDA
jgi:flagellar biogenesis protein FliO